MHFIAKKSITGNTFCAVRHLLMTGEITTFVNDNRFF